MATQRKWWSSTFQSAQDFGSVVPGLGFLFKAVTIDSMMIAEDSAVAAGLLQTHAQSGENVTYGYHGEMKYVVGSGGALPGQRLRVVGSGYLVPTTSGWYSIGRNAEVAVSSGAVGRGIFNFATPAYHQSV